jgi:hypothetical protein
MRDMREFKNGGYCLLELFVVSEILKFKVNSSLEAMDFIQATQLQSFITQKFWIIDYTALKPRKLQNL